MLLCSNTIFNTCSVVMYQQQQDSKKIAYWVWPKNLYLVWPILSEDCQIEDLSVSLTSLCCDLCSDFLLSSLNLSFVWGPHPIYLKNLHFVHSIRISSSIINWNDTVSLSPKIRHFTKDICTIIMKIQWFQILRWKKKLNKSVFKLVLQMKEVEYFFISPNEINQTHSVIWSLLTAKAWTPTSEYPY